MTLQMDDSGECYICMNPCKEVSPCECASLVHRECLETYLAMSHHRHCTICNRMYTNNSSTNTNKPPKQVNILLRFVLVFLAYVFSGYIGQAFLYGIGAMPSLPNGTFWTWQHLLGAWLTISAIVCFYLILKVWRQCTI